MSIATDTNSGSIGTVSTFLHTDDGGYTFRLQGNSGQHRVEVEYSRHYCDEIRIESEGVVEIQDDDGYFGPDDHIVCSCGERFETRSQAKDHLKNYRDRFNDLPPFQQLQGPVMLKDEETTVFDGVVTGRPSTSNHLLLVESGHDYLAATARETYTPPEDYNFDNWKPLTSGRLRHQYHDDWRPLFRPSALEQAMQVLTDNRHAYDPERYTIYFRGEAPIYIEGGTDGVLLAPLVPVSVK